MANPPAPGVPPPATIVPKPLDQDHPWLLDPISTAQGRKCWRTPAVCNPFVLDIHGLGYIRSHACSAQSRILDPLDHHPNLLAMWIRRPGTPGGQRDPGVRLSGVLRGSLRQAAPELRRARAAHQRDATATIGACSCENAARWAFAGDGIAARPAGTPPASVIRPSSRTRARSIHCTSLRGLGPLIAQQRSPERRYRE